MKNAITSIPLVASLVFGLSSACSTVSNSQVTFYGYPDNDPPGADTAHDCGGRNYQAGGAIIDSAHNEEVLTVNQVSEHTTTL